jgi:hypothetical protein
MIAFKVDVGTPLVQFNALDQLVLAAPLQEVV